MIFNHRFTLSVLPALLLVAFAACKSGNPGEGPEPVVEEHGVTLRLAIDMGMQAGSRAMEPDGFLNPEGEYEEIQTLRVIIVKGVAEDTRADEIEANKLVKTYANGTPINDNLEFKVSTGSKRIYLIANEASLPVPAGLTFSNSTAFLDNYRVKGDFNAAVFTDWIVSLPGGNPNATRSLYANVPGATGLPLTEFFDIAVGANEETLQYDETQTVHLFMTRAAAKATFNIKVADDYPGDGVSITGIRLNGLNWQQFVFPRATRYDQPKYPVLVTPGKPTSSVETTNRYITEFSTPERVNGVTGANVTLSLAEPVPIEPSSTGLVGPIYYPESLMPVTLASNPAARFSVQIEIGKGNWLDAKMLGQEAGNIQLVNGCQALPRNNWLQVNITLSAQNDITATVQVVPYVGVPLNPWFGLPDED